MKRFFRVFSGVLMVLLLVGVLPVYAQTEAEKVSMRKSLGEKFKTENITLGKIKMGKGWAVVSYSGKDKYYDFSGLALLKKQGESWLYANYVDKDATTEVLHRSKVPESEWGVLLDAKSIERNRPVLAFLHKKSPEYIIPRMRHAGDWTLFSWVDSETFSEGQGLLKKTGDTWKIVTRGGGAIDKNTLIHYGVPPAVAEKLIWQ